MTTKLTILWLAAVAAGCQGGTYLEDATNMAVISVITAIPSGRLSWEKVQKHRDVSLGVLAWNDNTLRIPLQITQKADDLSPITWQELSFSGRARGNVVRLRARLQQASGGPQEEVLVPFRSRPEGEIQIVYENPDKTLVPLPTAWAVPVVGADAESQTADRDSGKNMAGKAGIFSTH